MHPVSILWTGAPAQKRQSNPGWHGSPEGHGGTLAAKWCRCIEQCLWYGGVSRKQTESIV